MNRIVKETKHITGSLPFQDIHVFRRPMNKLFRLIFSNRVSYWARNQYLNVENKYGVYPNSTLRLVADLYKGFMTCFQLSYNCHCFGEKFLSYTMT